MERYMLKVGFKGEREYIQGPDIFNHTMQIIRQKHLGEICDVEFLIQRMATSHLQLEIEPAENARKADAADIAIIKLAVGNERLQARITAAPGVPEQRTPYDESVVTSYCQIDSDARSIQLTDDRSDYNSIEKLVSMNKALHLAVLEKPAGTQWVFCRWDSPSWPLPEALTCATVILRQTLGTRLTRADVMLDDHRLGQIYFSAKQAL
ncbi:hypothetical protein [Pseudomonas sp. GZD-222]|uniref:hypothetical protein n=1 Tax=Pseudomonas sp. GZD-222 TaxID=3404805 RepID=UPI003BB7BC8B